MSKTYKILKNKYPKILSKNLEMSCDLGWYDILDNLCYLIQQHVDNVPWVCKDSKFKQWLKNVWNKLAWNYVFYPIGRKICKLDTIPKSYLTTDPKYKEYQKIWDNWYKYSDKWQLKSEYKEPLYDKNRQVIATQVKEKFGTLRFYTQNGDDYTHGLISMAEAMSGITCEKCGSTKNIKKTKGWIITLCGECYKKRNK